MDGFETLVFFYIDDVFQYIMFLYPCCFCKLLGFVFIFCRLYGLYHALCSL